MAKVDFYILADTNPTAGEVFACRLAEKAYTMGHRIYVWTNNVNATQRLDDLLWTFRDGSFIPHQQAGSGQSESPVVVGHQEPPSDQNDLLINLSDDRFRDLDKFSRIAEIVCGDEETRALARQRFRDYREQGVEPESHQIA